ncbi:hypothetical protein GE09DRAFT_578097 [Coniochaeta sp. 2T2.1]|nr:hypothetical protein GE09DRAFT_578097 [Coniochaeta sp. 2T2.1]
MSSPTDRSASSVSCWNSASGMSTSTLRRTTAACWRSPAPCASWTTPGCNPRTSSPATTRPTARASTARTTSTNWLLKNCGKLVQIGKACLELVDRVEAATADITVCPLPREEVQSVVHRAGIHAELLGYVAKMLESQFGFYSNLLQQESFSLSMGISRSSKNVAVATQRDSISMKTVSYLTMVFLPATFVSAIFSTTVFDFQLWDGG